MTGGSEGVCEGCGRASSELRRWEEIEEDRSPRGGRPADSDAASAAPVSPRYAHVLRAYRLCPACLARAEAEQEAEAARHRRLMLAALVLGVVAALSALAFPTLWPELVRIASLKPRSDYKGYVRP